jgi:hypothetical protein
MSIKTEMKMIKAVKKSKLGLILFVSVIEISKLFKNETSIYFSRRVRIC